MNLFLKKNGIKHQRVSRDANSQEESLQHDLDMVAYKIIKYCRVCKKRFIVANGNSKVNYCDECQKRYLESIGGE